MRFTDVTIVGGMLVSQRKHDTGTLEPRAIEMLTDLLAPQSACPNPPAKPGGGPSSSWIEPRCLDP